MLAARETLATVDKQALRACGVRDFQILSSGVEAARLLAEGRAGMPEMVLCSEKLADMTAEEFVRLVRLHPTLVPYPILVAVSTDSKELRDTAKACGFSGLLVRPYTHGALAAQMELALRCRNATVEAMAEAMKLRAGETAAFETALARFAEANNPEDQITDQMYRQGLLSARQQRWDEAINQLQEVLRRNGEHVEAMIALGASWRGKGNPSRGAAIMGNAVSLLVNRREWEKALSVAQRVMQGAPETPNPLLAEAGRLLAGCAYDDMKEALETAQQLPISSAAVDGLVRACAASPDPVTAREKLLESIRQLGAKKLVDLFLERASSVVAIAAKAAEDAATRAQDTADTVYSLPLEKNRPAKKIKKKKGGQELSEPSPSAFEVSFPKLHEALMVAKVTLSLFRQLK